MSKIQGNLSSTILFYRKAIMILGISMMIFQFFFSDRPGNMYKHVGGYIGGVFTGLFLSPVYQNPMLEMMKMEPEKMNKNQKIMAIIGLGCYVLYLGFLMFLM
jgi:hypothetical protein